MSPLRVRVPGANVAPRHLVARHNGGMPIPEDPALVDPELLVEPELSEDELDDVSGGYASA